MKILIGIFLALSLFADVKHKMLSFYQDKNYDKACELGNVSLKNHKNNNEFLSLLGFSCLYSGNISALSTPIAYLKNSKEARSNASYFSVIVMQQKLLYHSLLDAYDITHLELPTTDNLLSRVFDLYSKINAKNKREVYVFTDSKDPKVKYKLYLQKKANTHNIVIEEYYDTISVKRNVYF